MGRGGGWLRPHAPQAGLSPARFASCGCFSGAHGRSGLFFLSKGCFCFFVWLRLKAKKANIIFFNHLYYRFIVLNNWFAITYLNNFIPKTLFSTMHLQMYYYATPKNAFLICIFPKIYSTKLVKLIHWVWVWNPLGLTVELSFLTSPFYLRKYIVHFLLSGCFEGGLVIVWK